MGGSQRNSYDLRELLTGQFYCLDCAGRLCDAATRLPGVVGAGCDPEAAELWVEFDPAITQGGEVDEGIRRLALETTGAVRHAAYRLTGLD